MTSRQREWQRKKASAGLCIICGTNPVALPQSARRCTKCNDKSNDLRRERRKRNKEAS